MSHTTLQVPQFLPEICQPMALSEAPGKHSGGAHFRPKVVATAWWSPLDIVKGLPISFVFFFFFF